MPNYHVRVHWVTERPIEVHDWSAWVEADTRNNAIDKMVKEININHDIVVPDTAEITIRKGIATY